MVTGLLWFVFVASALILALIILIQEGKGGGLGEAFGGMAAETFGVKASGVNKFTAILAAIFVLSSILINKCSMQGTEIFGDAPPPGSEAPLDPGGAGGTGGTDGSGGSGEGGN